MMILLTIAATLAVLIMIWTTAWLIVGMPMKDASGDGQLGIFILAFIWVFGPIMLISSIVSRLKGKS